MGKTEEKKYTFRNGKDLLERCVRTLNENQRGEAGGNVALYPVVIMMLGEKSASQVKYIKNTLDDNWNNARFLRYLKVVKQGDGWQAALIDQSEDKEEQCEWSTETEDFQEAINKVIVDMLEAEEKIFQDRSSVKFEYVLDATEEDAKEYFDLYQKTASQLQVNELKTLYLMLDQRPAEGGAKRSDELLQYMKENRKKDAETIYLLSNYLKAGRMLGEKYLFENYRLIADIILLGGNRGGSASFKENLYNGIKTVSYALVTKPTDEIAEVTLLALLSQIYEEDKTAFSRNLSEKDIREKLKIGNYQEIEMVEEIFQRELANHFPDSNSFYYLPFRSAKEAKDATADAGISPKALDAMTYGVYSSFVSRYFEEPAERLFENEDNEQEFRGRIRQELQDNFGFFELLALDEERDVVFRILEAEYASAGVSRQLNYGEHLLQLAIHESKKTFYEHMKKLYREEMEKLLDAAAQLDEYYQECMKEIQKELVVTGDESESVKKVYTSLVKEYVKSKQRVNERRTGFPEIFNVYNSKEELLQAFWEAYSGMIRMKEFSYDFEHEVDYRMVNMNASGRYQLVTNELEKRLEGSIRLKNIIDLAMLKMSCYYLISEDADYAKNLRESDKNGKEYTLFGLNRTDCIEQMEIYNIANPELLQLVRSEENAD